MLLFISNTFISNSRLKLEKKITDPWHGGMISIGNNELVKSWSLLTIPTYHLLFPRILPHDIYRRHEKLLLHLPCSTYISYILIIFFQLSFPAMEKRDVVLLIVTVAFYVTLILQFLGAVYLSVMATILPAEARIITLIALSLGLFWFMIGSIMLTIILYTSEYWRKWRYANKRKIVVLNTENQTTENCTSSKRTSKKDRPISGLSYELSLAVPV